MRNEVNRALVAKKNKFQSKAVPRGTRTIWRYLGALFLLFSLSIGQMWGAWQTTSVDATLGTRDSISTDGLTREWSLEAKNLSASDVSTSNTALEAHNAIQFKASSSGKQKFVKATSGLSSKSNSDIYVPVPIGSAGTITMSVYSDSESRWLQLYTGKGNTDAGNTKRLYSKYNATRTSDDKKGPRSFSFTATDTTMINGVAYLHFKDNNTEMKISGFSIVLTAGSYPVASGPVDPTITFNNGAYTVGATALDLSTLFSSNSAGTVTYSVKDADGTGAAIEGTSFSASAAGTAVVTASQAAETGKYNAKSVDANIVVSPAVTPACPSGLTISGTAAYTEGQTISLNAALSEGNGEITYTWYKGADLATAKAAGSIGTGTSFSKASCTTGDAGNYFCVATKDACSDAESTAYAVTVEEKTCPTSGQLYSAVTTATSNISIATTDGLELNSSTHKTTVSGGKMYVISKQSSAKNLITNGAFCQTNNDTYFKVELDCALEEGDVISINVGKDGSNDRGVWVSTATSRPSSAPACALTAKSSSLTPKTYVVTSTDEYVGKKVFYIYRATANSTYFNNVVITRPYSVLYDNLKEAIHTMPAKAVEFTLQELTNATFNHTGWTADKLVKVGGADKAAGTALGKTDKVTLTDNTTFTAVWEAKVTKYTVTYYDGEAIEANKLGSELINEGSNPTGAALAPRKLGYTFGGWSTTEGGAAVTLSDINVTEDMPLYAVWNAVNCATKSGTIYTMSIVVAPLANCTITSTTGTHDLYQYEGVSGGEALLGNKGTSNNCILQTNKKILLKDDNSYIKLDFDCPLKEGDKIVYSVESNNPVVSTGNSKPSTPLATLDRSKTEFVIPAESGLIDAQTIYIWKGGGNTTVTYINIVRPEKFDVTFNMQGHGTQVEPQNILGGGKVEEPATTDITGWDFGGWFTNAACSEGKEWAFATATVSQDTVLYAKWTEHVASNDVALGTLSVNGEAITIVPSQTVYAVELPMGTTATPTVTATANDENVKAFTITQTTAVDGSATIYVKAEDNTTEATYTINFSVATSKDIELVWDKNKKRCDDTTPTANVKSDDASVSAYINKITFTGGGAEGSSLNVGNGVGNMFTLSAKAGYAFKAMTFFGKIQDATCEFSLDGGAWTELTSTNTSGDACYADVFSAAEVHELRLRSTGASGVWIRNMQLTMIEACTPITLAWDEEPVEFEVGKSGYAIAATANNAGEVAYSSNATSIVDVNASTGVLTIAGLGSATLKAATAEGDGTAYCENGGNPIEISKVVNTYYLVQFDAQNETSVDEVKYYSGDAAIDLPAAPTYAGYDFQGWFNAETGGTQYTEAITPAASMSVYAQWVAQCDGPTITVQPEDASYLTGRAAAALACTATAGAAGELTYTWYSCDDAMRTNPVELAGAPTPSTAAAGTFYYYCAVTEAGCNVVRNSDVATITVADKDMICIIKAIPTSATAADADGAYKGSAAIKSSAKKLSSKYDYVAVQLKEGESFLATDKVVLNQTANLSGESDITKFYIFTEVPADGKTYVTVNNASPVKGDNWFTMPAEMDGESSLYIGRVDAKCNPTVGYLAVYRACAPILNKITVNGVEGAPVANVVTMDVPASTTQSQLEAIAYDWISNNDEWTAAHTPVAANAWAFGVANTVTLTDKDGDQSVYTITVNKAVPSSDATLSALSASAGVLSPTFDPAVLNYTVALPYGTSNVPTLSATKNFVGAADPVIVDAATFTNRQAVSTVTVTAEDGITELTYTVSFQVERFPSIVIWDGSTMSAVAESPDATTGFAWTVTGFSSVSNYSATCGAKAYTKCLPSGGSASASRNIALNVPEGYLAKFTIVFGTHSDNVDEERGMFIGTTPTKTLDESSVLTMYSNVRPHPVKGTSELVIGEGSYYINPMASVDFYEISATLMPVGYQRNVTEGRMGTVCLPANVEAGYIYGAEVYTLLYWKYGTSYQDCQMVDFEQVDEMQAGYPYMIIPTSDKFAVVYGDETYSGDGIQMSNGFTGTIHPIAQADDNVLVGKYGVVNNQIRCLGQGSYSPANRAYIDLSLTPSKEEYEAVNAPAPVQKRRVSLGRQGEQVATGLDAINASEKPMKIMINGQMYILRGEKIYDAKGQLVK